MSSFEIGVCDIDEYIANQEQRVEENNIVIGSLYTIMLLLNGRKAAAKYPAKINDADSTTNSGRSVDMTIMNADLAPDYDCKAMFKDGYWLRQKSQGIDVGKKSAIKGYLKSYADDMDGELQAIISLTITKPVETKSTLVVGMRGH